MNETLMYGGKRLDPAPLNTSMDALAQCLEHGHHPVIAELEPGDATYYNLLIVPAWGAFVATHLNRYGIPADRAHEYLIVTKLTDQQGWAFYATAQVGEWDLHGIENDWTREVLAWWLRLLWQEIERARGT